MTLLRIEYTKTGLLRYLGHLDMVRLFERGLRRGQVPLLFSQGFNPHPKIAFAAPLSVGYSSEAELVEIEVEEGWAHQQLKAVFQTCFPAEVAYRRHRVVNQSKSLMSMMRKSDYELKWSVPEAYCQTAAETIESFADLAGLTAVKKSKGKKDKEIELKPMVHQLKLIKKSQSTVRESVSSQGAAEDATPVEDVRCELCLFATLDAGSESNLKPDLLMGAIAGMLGIENEAPLKVHRTALYGEDGKALFEME